MRDENVGNEKRVTDGEIGCLSRNCQSRPFDPAVKSQVVDGANDILEKERVYLGQIAAVRRVVHCFFEPKGWQTLHRGRRAHASACGPVHAFAGVVDVEMLETDWKKMPSALQPDTSFTLWCSASQIRGGARFFSDTELFWQAPFSDLIAVVERFLPEAWKMLGTLTDANLLDGWPGPSTSPDRPSKFRASPSSSAECRVRVAAQQAVAALVGSASKKNGD